jgi:hypothetical protein
MTREQQKQFERNNELLRKAFQGAFPEQYQKRALMKEKAQEIRLLLEGLTETLKPMVTFQRREVSQDQLVTFFQSYDSNIHLLNMKQDVLERDRAEKLASTVSSFDTIHQLLFVTNSYEFLSDMEAPEDNYGGYTTWEALPRQLLDWIQGQEGLRIQGKPISSREMLNWPLSYCIGKPLQISLILVPLPS